MNKKRLVSLSIVIVLIVLGTCLYFFSNVDGVPAAIRKLDQLERDQKDKQVDVNNQLPDVINTVATSTAMSKENDVTIEDIDNAEYLVWDRAERVDLINKKYEDLSKHIRSDVALHAIADLDRDGIKDGLVVITTSRADSVDELFLIKKVNGLVITKPIGLPYEECKRYECADIEMRNINDIKINSNGVATIQADFLSPDDAHCCPSIHVSQNYILETGDKLRIKE